MSKSYLKFVPLSAPKNLSTKRWRLTSADGANVLGAIGWHSPWRRYVFYPQASTLFEVDCLREIADFLEKQTAEQRRRREYARKMAMVLPPTLPF